MLDSSLGGGELKARLVKSWVIKEFKSIGWSYVISSALPELLEYNSTFNCFDITKKTNWDKEEVRIIAKYLLLLHKKRKELTVS